MKINTISINANTLKFILPLLISMVLTAFLFYIDEGFYNFTWMLNIGNWIAFLFYLTAIYIVQIIIILPIFKLAPEPILISGKIILAILIVLFLLFILFK